MRTSFDDGRLRLAFATVDEATGFVDGVERESGFVAQLGEALPLHREIPLTLELDPGDRSSSGEIVARVAQLFDKGLGRFGVAFLVEDTGVARRWLEAADPEATGEGDGPEEGDGVESDEAPEPADAATSGEMRGTSPIHRIRQMNPRQKAVLALKAGRTERRILLRDKSPLVLQNLLNNPRIQAEDVLHIARSSHVIAPILQRIAGDTRWNGNQELLAVIARHPKTPSLLATRLLPSLRTSDLRTMAKISSGPKEMVRKAALREYMRRTGQRI